MSARRISVAVLVLVLATAVYGCTRAKSLMPAPVVEAQEPTVAAASAPVTGELPGGVPEGLPLWPGASVGSSKVSDDAFDLVLTTTDPVDEIVPGLATGFERAGWMVASSGEDAVSTAITVSNDAYEGVISVEEGSDGSMIEYLLTPLE